MSKRPWKEALTRSHLQSTPPSSVISRSRTASGQRDGSQTDGGLFGAAVTAEKEYDGQISILTGLETDFITGYEEETAAFLNTYGPSLDDGILSVHF